MGSTAAQWIATSKDSTPTGNGAAIITLSGITVDLTSGSTLSTNPTQVQLATRRPDTTIRPFFCAERVRFDSREAKVLYRPDGDKGSMKRNGIAAGAGFKGSVEQTREPSRWTTT
jgi:hypothetical protein